MDVLNFLWFSLVWRVNYYFCVLFATTFIGHSPSFMQQGLDVDMEFLYCFQSNNASNISRAVSCDLQMQKLCF